MPPDQILILRLEMDQMVCYEDVTRSGETATYGCSWKKNTSWTNIKPP